VGLRLHGRRGQDGARSGICGATRERRGVMRRREAHADFVSIKPEWFIESLTQHFLFLQHALVA